MSQKLQGQPVGSRFFDAFQILRIAAARTARSLAPAWHRRNFAAADAFDQPLQPPQFSLARPAALVGSVGHQLSGADEGAGAFSAAPGSPEGAGDCGADTGGCGAGTAAASKRVGFFAINSHANALYASAPFERESRKTTGTPIEGASLTRTLRGIIVS